MPQSPLLPSSAPTTLPPVLLTWPLMTAVGAAIFGAIVAAISDGSGSDQLPRLVMGVLMGGLTVGWLEWQTLRLYRVHVGPLWCGVNAGMLVLLTFIAMGTGRSGGDNGFWLLPLWGMMLDTPRWLLLRSHFPRAWWWLVLCGLGWLADMAIFLFVGISTIDLVGPTIVFVALNGAVNGLWMGFCRGGALMIMFRDRQAQMTPPPSPLPAK